MMDAERSEWEQSAPHDAFEWCHLYSVIYVAFQGCLIDHIQKLHRWTLSQSGVISDFNIKCSTRWVTVGESREIKLPWLWELLYLLGKGRQKMAPWPSLSWDWHSTTPHISLPTQVLPGTRLYVAPDDIVWEFESERKWNWTGTFKCNVFVRRTCCRTWKKRLRQVNIVVL